METCNWLFRLGPANQRAGHQTHEIMGDDAAALLDFEGDENIEMDEVEAVTTETGTSQGSKARKQKGRGVTGSGGDGKYDGRDGKFETVPDEGGSGPARSVEGYIIFVTGVHAEAQEEDILDKFSDFGAVKNINVNLDRRTGFVKGYTLVEFETKEEAEAAIKGMNGQEVFGQEVKVDWAIVKPASSRSGGRRR